jgi:hypothetical protein
MSRCPEGSGEEAADAAGRPRSIRRTDLLFPADGADALKEAVLDTTLHTMDEQVVAESVGKEEIPFELVPRERWDLGVPRKVRYPAGAAIVGQPPLFPSKPCGSAESK